MQQLVVWVTVQVNTSSTDYSQHWANRTSSRSYFHSFSMGRSFQRRLRT